jgi:transposase
VEESATGSALRSTARRTLACEQEATELEAQLATLVRQFSPHLLDQLGIGPVVAGRIRAVSDPGPPSPRAVSHPIEASSERSSGTD